MNKLNLILVFCFLFLNCEQKPRETSFYYWRSSLELDETEKEFLDDSNGTHLFVRFFDVDKVNGRFEPQGIITKKETFSTDKEIVPVIFITNRTWFDITSEDLDFLVEKVAESIYSRAEELDLSLANEIQIDSDWTSSTKQDYFEFLRRLKTQTQKEITSTLRLHQLRDLENNGVPPINKAYLMCYATSSPLEDTEVNSILNYELLQSYLSSVEDYPLELDYALPIYSWGIVTNQLGKKRLINGLSTQVLDTTAGIAKIAENQYEIEKDGFYFNQFLNTGFKIKIEEIPNELIEKSINLIDQKTQSKAHILWYHLDSRFLKNRKILQL